MPPINPTAEEVASARAARRESAFAGLSLFLCGLTSLITGGLHFLSDDAPAWAFPVSIGTLIGFLAFDFTARRAARIAANFQKMYPSFDHATGDED